MVILSVNETRGYDEDSCVLSDITDTGQVTVNIFFCAAILSDGQFGILDTWLGINGDGPSQRTANYALQILEENRTGRTTSTVSRTTW